MFDIQPTEESKAIADLKMMSACATSALNGIKECSAAAHMYFWQGEASPETKLALLGASALEIFTASATTQAFIKSIDPTHTKLGITAGYVMTWAQDGSATMTYTAPESEVEPEPEEEEEVLTDATPAKKRSK